MRRANRQSSRLSVVTGMSSTIVTGSSWQSGRPRCFHKQGVIPAYVIMILEKVKQTNGKENVINWLITPMERNMCLHTSFRGISFRKKERSMIYMIGQQVQKHLDKGTREESWYYPYDVVWIMDQETFCREISRGCHRTATASIKGMMKREG